MFNGNIFDVIIGGLLLDPNDESTQSTREKTLALFDTSDDAAVVRSGGDSFSC